MNEIKQRFDDFGRELTVGDFVYIGKGTWSGAQIAVIRGLEKSMHIIELRKQWDRTRNEVNGYIPIEGHVVYGARSILKMEPEWLLSFKDQELVRNLMNEKAKVLNGEYRK